MRLSCWAANVAQIFISCSSKHRELTRTLVAVIEAQYGAGSVWWDRELESRASYSEQIKAELERARVVVVIWTAGATISEYVYAEAVTAQAQGKLVNVRPADMSFRDIPEPFNIHHIDEAEDHDRILATIAKVMAGTPIPTRVPLHEIYFRQHGHRLIDPKQRPLPRDAREISPTDLLQAKYKIVPYVDITGMKSNLIAWCGNRSRATAGRLVHGPGGLGKTRLMMEVAAALRAEGWMAGFFDRPHEQVDATLKQRRQALDQLIAHGDDKCLLIVMDYAEGRQDDVRAVAQLLSRRPEGDMRPTRLVLLARSAGGWWTKLHDETPEVQSVFRRDPVQADVVALSALSAGWQRRDLFLDSAKAFGPTLAAQGYGIPTTEPSHDVLALIETSAGYARPLAVQMEALLWLASAASDAGTASVDVLLQRVLGLERAHWGKLLGALDEDRLRDLARGVAQVTIVQGTPSWASSERLLMADQFYQGQRTARVQVDPVLRNLERIYRKPDGGLAQLEPDLIGEHHVATIGDIELIEGCVRWIGDEPRAAQEKRGRDLLTVLRRATQPEHGATVNGRAATLLDDALHALFGLMQNEVAYWAADAFPSVGAGTRALFLWIAATGDGELPLVTAVGRKLEPALIATAIELLEACDPPNNHALYNFIHHNAAQLDQGQRRSVRQLVTRPVRDDTSRLADVLGWVALEHFPDAVEIQQMWSRWVRAGAFDGKPSTPTDLARYLADAHKEGLPGWEGVNEALRSHVRDYLRSGDKNKVVTAVYHVRAAADTKAPFFTALLREMESASGTAEWDEWRKRDRDTAEWTEQYVIEFVKEAKGDRDWHKALMAFAEQRRRISLDTDKQEPNGDW